MKKSLVLKLLAVFLLGALVISIILSNSNEHVDEIKKALDNTKIVKIYDYQTKELLDTYNEKESKEIIKELKYDKWQKSDKLNGDEKAYLLKLYSDEDSEDIAEITLFKSYDYVSVLVFDKVDNETFKINHDLKDFLKRLNANKK